MYKPYMGLNTKGKRKPLLRYRILRTLALNGNLTKKDTELFFKQQAENLGVRRRPHYKEISDAIDALSDGEFVERKKSSLARGKPYILTIKGLEVLAGEAKSEMELWSLVIGYCAKFKDKEKWNSESYSTFNTMLDLFRERFPPYKSIGSYSYILKIFSVMSRKLLTELNQDNSILEFLLILARRKEMTITEIETKMKKEESTIKEILGMLSMDTSTYSEHYTLTGGDDWDPENDRRRYIDFLQHCIVFYENRNGKRYYYLSLFGLLFLVKILRMKNNKSNKEKNGTTFEKAFNDIATIYPKKLPLIFGKWPLLKKYLNLLSVYNFGFVLLNKEESLFNKRELIELGYEEIQYDNKLIKNIYPMYVLNNMEWEHILDEGTKMLEQIRKSNLSEFNLARGQEIKEDFLDTWEGYLHFRRKFLNIETSIDEIFEGIRMHEKNLSNNFGIDVLYHKEDYLLPLRLIEKAFEDEVTLIYYLKLTDSYLEVLENDEGIARLNSSLAQGGRGLRTENINIRNDTSPRERLKLIVTRDYEIGNYLTMFMKDLSNYLGYELNDIYNITDSLELVVKEAK